MQDSNKAADSCYRETSMYRRAATVLAVADAASMSPMELNKILCGVVKAANENPDELRPYLDEILRAAYCGSINILSVAAEKAKREAERKADSEQENQARLADLLLQTLGTNLDDLKQ